MWCAAPTLWFYNRKHQSQLTTFVQALDWTHGKGLDPKMRFPSAPSGLRMTPLCFLTGKLLGLSVELRYVLVLLRLWISRLYLQQTVKSSAVVFLHPPFWPPSVYVRPEKIFVYFFKLGLHVTLMSFSFQLAGSPHVRHCLYFTLSGH